MSAYERCLDELRRRPAAWLVTGAAGFIGSNLTELLLSLGQEVVAIDDFSTGRRENLEDVAERVGPEAAARLRFVEDDIRDLDACRAACRGVDYVLHQAALGSVPRSLKDPLRTHDVNVNGFVNMLAAARDAGVRRFVYASSSSVYGDHPALPKREEVTGEPLSPYAVTKATDEAYAGVFRRAYGMDCVGLRYFNVFGRRQDPEGAYAAVIPRWVGRLLAGEPCELFGDGETSRDFCYVDNVLQANLLAATTPETAREHAVYNVACGERTTLNELFRLIRDGLAAIRPEVAEAGPRYLDFRAADIRHSLADIGRAARELGYQPRWRVAEGLAETLRWYADDALRRRPAAV
ncbi:MAG TPA: SDR family oxidoreductase [Longimicrobium sp.]